MTDFLQYDKEKVRTVEGLLLYLEKESIAVKVNAKKTQKISIFFEIYLMFVSGRKVLFYY